MVIVPEKLKGRNETRRISKAVGNFEIDPALILFTLLLNEFLHCISKIIIPTTRNFVSSVFKHLAISVEFIG